MKLRKLLVLALVLALFVCAFAACGDGTDTETNLPGTDSETDAPVSDTEDPGKETEDPGEECTHELEVEEKLATCTDRGYKKEVCKLCGETVSETAYPKAAHTPTAAATCTEDSKCSVCGEVLEAAKGHTFGDAVVVDATCLAEGSKTRTCSICNETVVEKIPALAHDIQDVTASTAATCTTEGSKTGICTLCKQEQTVAVPAGHTFKDLGDLSALTFVNGKLQATCSGCNATVDVAGDLRFALNFDEADVPTELAKWDGFAYGLTYNPDQAGTVKYPPVTVQNADATDGHTSVLSVPHNSSAAIQFGGSLLSDSDYYVISFDWRATKFEHTSNKVGGFGLADTSTLDTGASDGSYVYAFRVDRSNGELYNGASKEKFSFVAEAGRWYHIDIVVDHETGTAYTYFDGVCVATLANDKWIVAKDGTYTWRFGGVYNVFHRPEFDNFTVVAINKSESSAVVDPDGGEEGGDPEDDGTGCDHKCYLEVQLPTPEVPGFIKRTCNLCGRVVTYEIMTHICYSDTAADCVTDSRCDECGELIEAAWGHALDPNAPITETPADPACGAPGTRTGKCLTCGQDVVEDLEPAAHTFIVSSIDQLQLVDGEIKAVCSVCGQLEVVSESVLMAIDFESDVNSELAAHENANKYGFAYGTVYHYENQAASPVCALAKVGQRTVLSVSPWASGRAGNHTPIIKFSGDMLGATSYYVVSFDVCFSGANDSDTPNYKGFFGLKKLASNTLPTGKYTLPTTVSDFALVADRTAKASADKSLGILNGAKSARKDVVKNDWYSVTILVDNVTGKSTIYIDGTLLGVNDNNKMLVEGGQYYLWLFGTDYNNGQRAQFDSFKVYALGTECLHTDTSPVEVTPATCTATGTANLVCNKCGEVAGTEDIPMLDHVASTNVIEEKSCCTVYACTGAAGGCTETVNVAKEGATHAVSAPTTFDANTIIKDGKIQAACAECGLYFDAPITEDIRLALNFDKTDLATEVAALNTANSALGLTVTNDTAYETKVYDEGATTALRCISGSPLWITFKSDVLADSSYYMISLDWRFTNATNYDDVNAPFTFYGDTTSAWAANPFKYHRGDKVFLKGNAGTDVVYPTDGSTLNLNEWYHITLVVDNSTGKVYVYINDTYAQTVSTAHVKMVTGGAKYWRFNESSSGHSPEYDNFKVEVLAKTAVTE